VIRGCRVFSLQLVAHESHRLRAALPLRVSTRHSAVVAFVVAGTENRKGRAALRPNSDPRSARGVRRRAVGAPGGGNRVSSWLPRALSTGSGAALTLGGTPNKRLKLAGRYVHKEVRLAAW
jgi:hypothetical protein